MMAHQDLKSSDSSKKSFQQNFSTISYNVIRETSINQAAAERDNVIYWKTNRKIKNDLQCCGTGIDIDIDTDTDTDSNTYIDTDTDTDIDTAGTDTDTDAGIDTD